MMFRFLMVIFGLVFGFFVYEATSLYYPTAPESNEKRVVLIPKGAHLSQIARILEAHGVVESGWKFKALARFKNVHRKLQPGEYSLSLSSSPAQALEAIQTGKVLLHRVTFPEGWTMEEIKNLLSKTKLVDAETFEKLLRNENLAKELGLPGPHFEGYLFPETYFFSRTETEQTILRAMVQRFFDKIQDGDRKKAENFGWGLREWTTMASIIEKESSDPSEHRRISSVFHNRLQEGMRLQSDPTVIYGMDDYKGNIQKKHLEEKTPYNTYRINGLPPTPIANPGESAIHAAVNPEKTRFLYFVAKRDGTHIFTKTYEDHLKAVNYYQLKRGKKPIF